MRISGIFLMAGLVSIFFGCASLRPKAPAWPPKNQHNISNIEYLDITLRVLALELASESEAKRSYAIQAFPEQGLIRASCRMRGMDEPANLKEAVETEVRSLKAGILNAVKESHLEHGFQTESNIEIRVQSDANRGAEVAVFEGGQTRWLSLVEPKKEERVY